MLTLHPLRNPLLFFGTMTALLLHVAAMHTLGVRGLLHVTPVPAARWAATIAMALSLLATLEIDKAWSRRSPGRGASSRDGAAPSPVPPR